MFQKTRKTVLRGMLTTALLLPLAGCDQSKTAEEKPVQPAGSVALKEDANAQLATKLNAYVSCFNTADGAARHSAQRYVSWIHDLDKGPTGKERTVNVPGDLTAYELDSCTKAIGEASSAKPALPALDSAAVQYLSDLTALVPLASQAHQYYSQEDYKDDGFARGKQMHQPLMMAYGRFIKSSDVYGDEVEKETVKLTDAQLVEIEKTQGRHSPYYRLALVSQGKRLAAQLSADATDVAAATKAIEAYGALVDESDKATASEPGKPVSWSVFQTSASTFLKDCKDRMRRVRDKTPYSRGEQGLMENNGSSAGWTVTGSPMRVLKSYNDLVEASNRL